MNELQQRVFSLNEEISPPGRRDRRREPRTREPRLVHIMRPAGSGSERFEEVRTMRDYSRSGFYFIADRPSYQPGLRLHVVPEFGCLNLEYLGEVVRVDPLPFGEYGVAVRLIRVENLLADPRSRAMAAYQTLALSDRILLADSHSDFNISS